MINKSQINHIYNIITVSLQRNYIVYTISTHIPFSTTTTNFIYTIYTKNHLKTVHLHKIQKFLDFVLTSL